MRHSIRATLSTALAVGIVSTPFVLSNNSAEAEPPRPQISLPGITINPTVILGEATIELPNITVALPPIRIPPSDAPTQSSTPSQSPTNEPSEPSTSLVAPSANNEPTEPQEANSFEPVVPEEPTRTPRQEPTTSDTVVPEIVKPPHEQPNNSGPKVITKVVLGTVIIIVMGLLGIFAMFFGYALGRKDGERCELGFTRALIRSVRGE